MKRRFIQLYPSKSMSRLQNQTAGPEILAEIQAQDEGLAYLGKLPQDAMQGELYFINNTIHGYRQYLRREGVGVLEELERKLNQTHFLTLGNFGAPGMVINGVNSGGQLP
jgi:hypothetical protein